MKDPIWTKYPERFAEVTRDNRHYILHPFLAKIALSAGADSILDHGCGDGAFNYHLPHSTEIGLYDINESILQIAQSNLSDYPKKRIFKSPNEIPKGQYDCVISSNVLMTIDNDEEYEKVLNELTISKKEEGLVLIGITHPCFRQSRFSTFETSYCKGQPFDYFSQGDEFKVFMKLGGNSGENEIAFSDFHYSLSCTIKKLLKSGLEIIDLFELNDSSINSGFYNPSFPPFLVIKCK